MADTDPKPNVSENAAVSEPKEKEAKYVYDPKGAPPLNIFLHWCKSCNICIVLCPHKVLEPDRDGKPVLAHPEKCTQCAICWLHCPDFAITSNFK